MEPYDATAPDPHTPPPRRQIDPEVHPVTGRITYTCTITRSTHTGRVRMNLEQVHVLPIIFVPGAMGSNLQNEDGAVWVINGPSALVLGGMNAAKRQQLLHPGQTSVFRDGDVPKPSTATQPDYIARGWGEVSADSYQSFLLWLEENLQRGGAQGPHAQLNQLLQGLQQGDDWNALKPFAPLTAEECRKAERWSYPVYACGYNWLQSCAQSADLLAARVDDAIRIGSTMGTCDKVILITHSMGGLVARYCSEFASEDIDRRPYRNKIAAIIHGAMPAVGAPVAYRRCKVGAWDEVPDLSALHPIKSFDATLALGTAAVIGANGREVTALFAQSPGALQLLPTKQYPTRNWLEIRDLDGRPLPTQPDTTNPYNGVYRKQTEWWGLIRSEWLRPEGSRATIVWNDYSFFLDTAEAFHEKLQNSYHPNTWGFYGNAAIDRTRQSITANTFERITWALELGNVALTSASRHPTDVLQWTHQKVRQTGSNPATVPLTDRKGNEVLNPYYEMALYRLRLRLQDAHGDGTVPVASGEWPARGAHSSGVQQFFCVRGIEHQGAFKKDFVRHLVAYAIAKIAAALPTPNRTKPS